MNQDGDNFVNSLFIQYFISKIDSNLSIIEGPFHAFSDSEDVLSPFKSNSFFSPNKTFDRSPLEISSNPYNICENNSMIFKSICSRTHLQSTRIDGDDNL
ncbi:hypothetical protein RF11_05481 [Thelohanellus kitauei]|uniref:Uncharacterized protein n=1 Tax=Thelohanellus kitauei TaxID=669202 RepID=A0A0C2MCC0_THEKT|nr:hypothetical protein RF11_05481 [Thelohanellus kitauei]